MTTLGKTALGGIIIVAAFVAMLMGRGSEDAASGHHPNNKASNVSEIFAHLARSANALKGAEVETDVFFDGATVEEAETLTYTYTVGGVANRPFDSRIVGMATDRLNRESCADPIVRTAIDDGGAIRYVYRSPGGTRLLAVDVDRQSCFGFR